MILEENMAAGADLSCTFITLEDNYDNISTAEDESLANVKHLTSGKPPRHHSAVQHCVTSARLLSGTDLGLDSAGDGNSSPSNEKMEFAPALHSGCCAERGPKDYMEDEHICINNLVDHLGETTGCPSPRAFYGVFDGHGGTDAAVFVRDNILRFILEDAHFPIAMEKAIKSAFLKADYAFADASSLDISSGTTALVALIFGRLTWS
ncbi:hypothetical protein SAY87_004967 [Trapa incisa]|uniref:protein-serine/threonine phosphatase n=1 Tax=Trapa incisa TaxID=236973 RepID=A0AAN7JPM3_9MYRT|nr:hypothetical protein SAY87_004967 [Trapa incisa]